MSAPRKISDPQSSRTQSRKATVVKIIRGTSKPTPKSEPRPTPRSKPTPKPIPTVKDQARGKVEPVKKAADPGLNINEDPDIVLKAVDEPGGRTRYREFTEMAPRPKTREPGAKRLARGPHFPMATTLRIAALFYIIGRISVIVAIGGFLWIAITEQKGYIYIAPVLAAAIVFSFIAWGMSSTLRCRVCTMPFLSKRKCKMSKKAPKLPLVSHHFTAALHILTHNYPRCPYCGTTNRLKK